MMLSLRSEVRLLPLSSPRGRGVDNGVVDNFFP
jgi:hypothetical protein